MMSDNVTIINADDLERLNDLDILRPASARASVDVEVTDLRAALGSVLPHSPTKGEVTVANAAILFRLTARHVFVAATDRITAALAAVSVWKHNEPELVDFYLTPYDVKRILAVFPSPSGKGEPDDALIRISLRHPEVTLTEVGGLLEGRSLTVQAAPVRSEAAPATGVPARFVSLIRARPSARVVWANPGDDRKFAAASTAYGHSLIRSHHALASDLASPAPAAMQLIRCGDSFLGLVIGAVSDEDRLTEAETHRQGWAERLADAQTTATLEETQ